MKDLSKVNASQLKSFWKNLSVGLLMLMGTLVLSRLLPSYFSPMLSLIAAAYLYTLLYNNKINHSKTCMVVPYAVFYCLVVSSFVAIILNVLNIWSFIAIPQELSFFNEPFMPSLYLDPVCFVVFVVLYIRRKRLAICIDCKIERGISTERGKLGEILGSESRRQLLNLMLLFGALSIIVWGYYLLYFGRNVVVNDRDWYIFQWINVIAVILDLLYFASRYYNIYLDLKENGEIISEEELSDMTAKTYIRYYVICGGKIFLNPGIIDPYHPERKVIDTPFVTKRNVNGIAAGEVMGIIHKLTNVNDGELRFFFGRRSQDIAKHRILRYFYFVDEKENACPEIELDGEWVDFERVKMIYNNVPQSLSRTFLTDISRMVTIILTQKIFDERGYRKLKLKSYVPTFNLSELRENHYDFQDDKWLRIAAYNSDTRGFHFKKWRDKLMGRKQKGGAPW